MKRAVITGGAGFIGQSIIASSLSASHEICVVDRQERLDRLRAIPDHVEVIAAAPEDTAAWAHELKPGDVLLHLACRTIPATSMTSIAADVELNVVSAARAFESAAWAGVERVVFASSGGTVYGNVDTIPVTEAHACQPVSAYGASKLATEHYLSVAAANSQLRGVSLRIGNPTGPGQFRDRGVGSIAAIVQAVHDGEPVSIWGDGTVVRDFLDVRDLAEAFVLATTVPDLDSGSYNIGSGVGHSLNEIVRETFAVAHRESPVEYSSARAFDVPRIALDSTKFREQTGWHPERDLRHIITDMWSYLEHAS